jgi:hypothetical protein
MSTFKIRSRGQLIGETDLEMHDSGMNVRMGGFHPSPGYLQVRSVFKAYSDAMDLVGVSQQKALGDYYRRRDELALTIQDPNGQEVPASSIHIVDLDDSMEDIQIELYPPHA